MFGLNVICSRNVVCVLKGNTDTLRNPMRIALIALTALLTVSASLTAGETTLDSKVWHQELNKAHLLAKSQSKPMLIVFGAEWCKFCKKLEKETLSDKELDAYIQENFIPVHLDLDEQRAVGKILEVKSLPCTVILSPGADLLGKIVGYKSVPDMKKQLDKALQTQQVLRQAAEEKVIK